MACKILLKVAAVAVLSFLNADAAFMKTNIRGSSIDAHHLAASNVIVGKVAVNTAINWGKVAMGAGIGILVAGIVIGAVMFVMKKKAEAKAAEGDDLDEPFIKPTVEADPKKMDYAALLQQMTQKMADEVGPKFSKDGACRKVLEQRFSTFQDKAKNFMLSEMNSTAGAVMREMEQEESLLMLEWDKAIEQSFPPASILIAGVLSPTVINFMSLHHFVQVLTVGLPLFLLCIWAVYTDWGAPCAAIPTVFAWIWTQTVLAGCLFIGHGLLFAKLHAGKKRIQAKKDEVESDLKGSGADGSFSNLKEQFVGRTIILQEALQIENSVRHSFLNTVVGLATVIWLLTTIWNLVLICGWTFVPGVVAFHPKAQAVAPDEYCGAWATIFVLKVSMILSVLYLFLNLATVVQWCCDMMIESKGFSGAVLTQARAADNKGTGLPVAEMLAKAFLLRGGDESLVSRLAVVQHHKKTLQHKKASLESKLSGLEFQTSSLKEEEDELTEKCKDGGDLAAQVAKLNSESVDYGNWRRQGAIAIDEAETKTMEVGAATTEALEKVYEKIQETIETVENSDTVKAAVAAAKEAEAAIEHKMREAYDMLNDPEFQAKVKEYAEKAKAQCEAIGAQAKELADEAIAAASDPEFQKKLQDAAHEAMEEAKALSAKIAEAAEHSPELQAKLQEVMEQAQAKAKEAAAAIQDPALQRKIEETARQSLEQVQAGAEAAKAALIDPETQKKMQDACDAAMAEAQSVADSAIAAATDPKLKAAALAKLKEAQETAEKAAALATDPKIKKKLEETAQKALEQAQQLGDQAQKAGAEGAKKAQAAAKEGAQKAQAVAKDVGEKAQVAGEQAQAKAKEVGEKAQAAATEAGEQAQAAAKDAGEQVEKAVKGKKGKK